MNGALYVEPDGESSGHCDCCGKKTRTIWGCVRSGEQAVASYFLQWTRRTPQHHANLDFLIGTWGDETAHDGKLVSWVYNPAAEAFMAIDSAERPAAKSRLCSQTLTREAVITNSSLMGFTTELIDAV